jgi:hypothetical protein
MVASPSLLRKLFDCWASPVLEEMSHTRGRFSPSVSLTATGSRLFHISIGSSDVQLT